MKLRFGLGAWSNRHFDQALYPLGTAHAEYLPRYSRLFDCAEADVLHHVAADDGTMLEWVEQTPKGFLFLPKMHKDATHGPTMRGGGNVGKKYAWLRPEIPADPAVAGAQKKIDEDLVAKFMHSIEPLRQGKRLGPVLLQFAPTLEREPGWDRLQSMLASEPPRTFAVEVRHKSWFVPAFENMLEDFEAPLVWSTYPGAFAPPWRTADYGYIRFTGSHKPKRGRRVTVADRLSEITEIGKRLRDAPWKECFVIVSNPFEGNAVDSMPRIARELGAHDLAKKLQRPPGETLFAKPVPLRKGA